MAVRTLTRLLLRPISSYFRMSYISRMGRCLLPPAES